MSKNHNSSKVSFFSILFMLFSFGHLIYSLVSKGKNTKSTSYNINSKININSLNNSLIKYFENQSNEILYKEYNELELLNENYVKRYKLSKITKDTIVSVDLFLKMTIPKNSFFQKNYDDSLYWGFKTKANITVFIHKYASNDNIISNFKALKKGKKLNIIKPKIIKESGFGFITYTLFYKDKRYNGFSYYFKTDDDITFIEFESNNLTMAKLQKMAETFFSKQSEIN